MSYILDALKKAERERGIAKVPTLETIHKTPARSNRSLWFGLSVILILLLIGTGMYLLIRGRTDGTISDAEGPAVQQERIDMPGAAVPQEPPAGVQQSRSTPDSIERSSSTTESIGGIERSPGTQGVVQSGVSTPDSAPVASETSDSDDDAPEAFTPTSMDLDTTSSADVLRQAIEEMRISIHLYSETPEDRMIFINGRKYLEGDYINDLFLIESITPDGAVLRYEDERETLQVSM